MHKKIESSSVRSEKRKKNRIVNYKKIIIEDIVNRFDYHFGGQNDLRTNELRKYIREYYYLQEQVSDAFVPRIFVLTSHMEKKAFTNTVWTVNIPTVIPPTDFIALMELGEDSESTNIMGRIDAKRFCQVLSPYLRDLNHYQLAKKLSLPDDCIDRVIFSLEQSLEPLPNHEGIESGDVIPSFNEDYIFRNMDDESYC